MGSHAEAGCFFCMILSTAVLFCGDVFFASQKTLGRCLCGVSEDVSEVSQETSSQRLRGILF